MALFLFKTGLTQGLSQYSAPDPKIVKLVKAWEAASRK
jgi:hypothetical protein